MLNQKKIFTKKCRWSFALIYTCLVQACAQRNENMLSFFKKGGGGGNACAQLSMKRDFQKIALGSIHPKKLDNFIIKQQLFLFIERRKFESSLRRRFWKQCNIKSRTQNRYHKIYTFGENNYKTKIKRQLIEKLYA